MLRAISRAWQVVGSGASFALFGLGGVFLAVVAMPWIRLTSRSQPESELRCQRVVHRAFRFFVRFMEVPGWIALEVRGAERLAQPGQLVVANHPTLLDVVYLVALMPQADCVVKPAIRANPFMRGVAAAAGYLSNDLGEELVDACAARLRAGRSVLLFPEGTRSPAGDLGHFRRGAAHVALRSGRPIRPVVITCDPPALARGQRWTDVGDRPLHIGIECCDAIDPAEMVEPGNNRGAGARRITAALRDFYGKKLQNRGFRGPR